MTAQLLTRFFRRSLPLYPLTVHCILYRGKNNCSPCPGHGLAAVDTGNHLFFPRNPQFIGTSSTQICMAMYNYFCIGPLSFWTVSTTGKHMIWIHSLLALLLYRSNSSWSERQRKMTRSLAFHISSLLSSTFLGRCKLFQQTMLVIFLVVYQQNNESLACGLHDEYSTV